MSAREHKISDFRRDEAIKLRKENMTYREIAETMGISKQYVALLLKDTVKQKSFHRLPEDSFPYPALTKWLNDNQISIQRLAQIIGYSTSGSIQMNVYNRLKQGKFSKKEIDAVLMASGQSYEEMFREAD